MCITKKVIKFRSLYCVKRPGEFNEVIIDTNDAAAVINEIRWWQRYCNDLKNTLDRKILIHFNDLKKENDELRAENNSLKEENKDYKELYESRLDKYKELESKYNAISHNFDIVHKKNLNLLEDNKKLKEQNDHTQDYCAADVLLTETNLLRMENCELKEKNEALKKENKELKDKVSNLTDFQHDLYVFLKYHRDLFEEKNQQTTILPGKSGIVGFVVKEEK